MLIDVFVTPHVFFLANLNGFDPKTDMVQPEEMVALDAWAIDRAARLQEELLGHYEQYELLQVFQKISHFCSQDMGGFYLDIIKDRQYTAATDSSARKSAQTALHHIVEALARWIAPICSFTADEIWAELSGERTESVHLDAWYQGLAKLPEGTALDSAYWEQVMAVKTAVNKQLEEQRNAGNVGGSLEAEVTLYCDDNLLQVLSKLEDELRFVLITSQAAVAPLSDAANAEATELDGLKLSVVKSAEQKCPRCWHYRADIGQNADEPELCGRCVENVTGEGESRSFA
jgi:isoleucyl-tRNA synthetase